MPEDVLVEAVIRWGDLSVRPLDPETVDRYAEDIDVILREAPPFVAFDLPDGRRVLAAGRHRSQAAAKAGRRTVPVEVRRGTEQDALAFALRDNMKHGRPLTTVERAEGVQRLLDQGWTRPQAAEAMQVKTGTINWLTAHATQRRKWEAIVPGLDAAHYYEARALPSDVQQRVLEIAKASGGTSKDIRELARHVRTENDSVAFRDLLEEAIANRFSLRDLMRRLMGDGTAEAAVATALEDPEFLERALQDPSMATTIHRASARLARRQEETSDREFRERSPGLAQASDFTRAKGALYKARREILYALDLLKDVTMDDRQREEVTNLRRQIEGGLEWIESFVKSGNRSFEAELAALLNEEDE